MKKDRRVLDILMILLLLTGIGIVSYPFVSDGLNTLLDRQLIAYYQQQANQENSQEIAEKTKKMTEQNQAAANGESSPGADPFVEQKSVTDAPKDYFETHTIGVVSIPKIKVRLPIFDETTELLLTKGAGLLAGTSFPIGGTSTHTVLSGHRGLPEAALFTDLPDLEAGDRFYIEINQDIHAYEVDQKKVVLPTETDDLLVVPGQDYVTLMTCTPYMVNSHRLLVRGHRIPYVPEEMDQEVKAVSNSQMLSLAVLAAAGSLVVLLLVLFVRNWWRSSVIQRRRYQMILQLRDQTAAPITEVCFQLFDRRKQPVKQGKELVLATTDTTGLLDFGLKAGGKYWLKETRKQEAAAFIKVYVHRVGDPYFSYKTNHHYNVQLVKGERPVVEKQA